MRTQVCRTKNAAHRVWRYVTRRVAFTVALFWTRPHDT